VNSKVNLLEEEIALIDAFVLAERRERLRSLVANPRRREQFVEELAHFKWLDSRRVRVIAPKDQKPESIASLLKQKGARDVCFVISEDDGLDRKRLPLLEALKQVVGYGMGTFISCVPGKLAYFENEDQRCLLENK
jgi:hypothetical protein